MRYTSQSVAEIHFLYLKSVNACIDNHSAYMLMRTGLSTVGGAGGAGTERGDYTRIPMPTFYYSPAYAYASPPQRSAPHKLEQSRARVYMWCVRVGVRVVRLDLGRVCALSLVHVFLSYLCALIRSSL